MARSLESEDYLVSFKSQRHRLHEFLKLSGYYGSRFLTLQARKEWATRATGKALKRPGCIAAAYCFLTLGRRNLLLFAEAHSQASGAPEWKALGGIMPKSGTTTLQWRCAPNTNNTWFQRNKDAEYQLLNSIASNWTPEQLTGGFIVLYVELPPCSSCSDVIAQFRALYPGVDLAIQFGTPAKPTPGGAPRPAVCGVKDAHSCAAFHEAVGVDCLQRKSELKAPPLTDHPSAC